MNILIIGRGGREHALAWKASQSKLANRIYVAPGNAGTALEPDIQNVNIAETDIPALVFFAKKFHIGLTIVGPEEPLVNGIVDAFHDAGLRIFGPTQAASQLESSKIFSKNFLIRHNIPTAYHKDFTEVRSALSYVRQQGVPIVVKADGLTAGKGVIVATTMEEAESAIRNMLIRNSFGKAGHRILIEEYLNGEEISFIVMVDGKNVLPMATSQDYKRISDGDVGQNTGGMGAYSPVPIVTDLVHYRIMEKIIFPTIKGMAKEGNIYTGFLYAGIMISADRQPKVIEFNCRFGDPEAQVVILRIQSDLVAHCLAATKGCLDRETLKWDERSAVTIVMAAGGYPGPYRKGDEITGLSVRDIEGEKIFHSGTCLQQDKILTKGGRVLCVTVLGNTISDARIKAYRAVHSIYWRDCFYRCDIGSRVSIPD